MRSQVRQGGQDTLDAPAWPAAVLRQKEGFMLGVFTVGMGHKCRFQDVCV